jgi:transposase
LSAEQKNLLKVVLGDLPEKHGITGKRWSGKQLSSYISQQYGITLGVRACQRLLRKLNVHHSGGEK